MAEKKKSWTVSLTLSVNSKGSYSYDDTRELYVNLTEDVPEGTEPVPYLRARLNEAWKRKFNDVTVLDEEDGAIE